LPLAVVRAAAMPNTFSSSRARSRELGIEDSHVFELEARLTAMPAARG
jgi:hypothetical protein